MPTDSRTAVCSLTTPAVYSSGIDQPPNSANFAPRATWRSCNGELRQAGVAAHGTEPTAAPVGGPGLAYPASVTTYNLRNASPAKTRADAVVVGIVQHDKGPRVAPGGEDVAKAYGRKFQPLLATLGVTGKAGEIAKVPTGGTLNSPLLILAGLGKQADATSVRRAAGAAARAATNAASVAVALPADTPELVRSVTEGYLLGGYTFTTYKKDTKSDAAGTVTVLSPIGPQAGVDDGVRGGADRRDRGRGDPRLGQHPAGRPDSPAVRRRGRRGGQEARQGPRRPQGEDRRPRRGQARRARLRRHPRRRRRARAPRRGWSS